MKPVVSLLVAALALATAAPAPADPPVRVAIRDLAFVPKVVHAEVGQVIEWTNDDSTDHTVTSGTTADDGRFATSPNLAPGATFQIVLKRPGTYPYYCKLHFYDDAMHGTIVVAP